MKTHLIAIFCLVSISLMGQKTYAPAWESLDTRPVPSWFENAKFEILPGHKFMTTIRKCTVRISLMLILLLCLKP